jgi:hypothetical protein
MKSFYRLSILAALGAASLASAQPGAPSKPVVTPQTVPIMPVQGPKYESLVKRNEAGKIIRITGVIDALALMRNPQLDDAARTAMGPAIAEWTADVDQIAIDNLDFVEQFEGGLLDSFDVNDATKTHTVQQMNAQLQAAGPLSARLSQKGLFTGQSAGVNMQISNEYIQSVFNEINSAPPPAGGAPGQPYANAAAVNRFFTSLSSRDACEQYRRMLVDSAALVDRILPDMTAPARMKAAPKVAAVKAAQDEAAKLVAVRDMLREMSFDDRRAFLGRAMALGAAADPFHPAPEFPAEPGKAAAPATAAPVTKPKTSAN